MSAPENLSTAATFRLSVINYRKYSEYMWLKFFKALVT